MGDSKRTDTAKLRELRMAVREYLSVTMFVPFRAVDCDQEAEARLREKLEKLSLWREEY